MNFSIGPHWYAQWREYSQPSTNASVWIKPVELEYLDMRGT